MLLPCSAAPRDEGTRGATGSPGIASGSDPTSLLRRSATSGRRYDGVKDEGIAYRGPVARLRGLRPMTRSGAPTG